MTDLQIVPIVDNPDPAQLERLGKITGDLKKMLIDYADSEWMAIK